jgi:hypothetical protein
MKATKACLAAVLLNIGLGVLPLWGGGVVSNGSYGPLVHAGYTPIDLDAVAPDGVLHCTTIHVPPGTVLGFVKNNLNTPVFLAATGDVLIEGTIEVNGKDYYADAGPGGNSGGPSNGEQSLPGNGPAGGQGGGPTIYFPPPVTGNAGGGGGMATAGATASERTGPLPGLGGPALVRPVLTPGASGGGGSGGGSGSGGIINTVLIEGGAGGGGGGAIQISTPGLVTITGTITANGGHGAAGYGNGLTQSTGPGGGGSGGNIEIYADRLVLGSTALIQARGGAGGGYGSEPVSLDPFFYSSKANGGAGYVFLEANQLELDPIAGIDAIANIFPTLGIRKNGAQVVVHWPMPAPRYFLQESADLSTGSWADVTTPATLVGSENQVSVAPVGKRFYRLIQR